MIELYNMDNMLFETDKKAKLIYMDYMYENKDFSWAKKYWNFLIPEGGIFIASTDWHTNHRYRVFMEDELGAFLVNDAVVKCEWGNHPKDRFYQCFDNAIIYSNSKTWEFDGSKVQVNKVTKNKGLNPSGRITKQATAWIDDCTLTTTSLERQKGKDGKLMKWQKPLSLIRRLFYPFVKSGDLIIDGFMGVGSSGVVAKELDCDYIGIEYDIERFEISQNRLFG